MQQNPLPLPLPLYASLSASAVLYGSASPLPLRSHIQAKEICFLLSTNAAATPLSGFVAEIAGTMIKYRSGSIILISFDCNTILSYGSGNFCNDFGERCGGGISRQEEADLFSLNVRPKRQRRCRAIRYCRGKEGGAKGERVLLQT